MTHATIELLNADPRDVIQIQRTQTGLLIHYQRGERAVSAAIKPDALETYYTGHDPLGQVISDLRDRLSVDEGQLAGT